MRRWVVCEGVGSLWGGGWVVRGWVVCEGVGSL